jgi:hypothetical protein
MGLAAEVSVPAGLRWIPKGMDVSYLKPAHAPLTAKCTIPDSHFALDAYPGTVSLGVTIEDSDGVQVSTAEVRLWITEKKHTRL